MKPQSKSQKALTIAAAVFAALALLTALIRLAVHLYPLITLVLVGARLALLLGPALLATALHFLCN
jgi:hypothetical protein